MKTRKVLVYATHAGRIALLYHPDHPEAGIQVPGGTTERGETVQAAALRELREETGLTGSTSVRIVGEHDVDMSLWGRGMERRSYVHVELDAVLGTRWDWAERTPSTGEGPIRLEIRMVPLSSVPGLIAGHGSFLSRVR